jgi:hypothetical protein
MRSLVFTLALAVALVLAVPAAAFAAGSISGTVTAASGGAGIAGVEVCAWETGESEGFECAVSSGDGAYSVTGLSAGTYKVEFWAPEENYIFQLYDGKSTWAEATPVTVSDGVDTPGIDAALQEGGRISGRVTDAATNAGIGGILACASTAGEEFGGCSKTEPNGEYAIGGLPAGSYEVFFFEANEEEGAAEYLGQVFRDGHQELVSVTVGATVPGIDAALSKAGRISGTVTDSLSGAGIGASTVCLRRATTGEIEGCTRTNGSGRYSIGGLSSGSYKVWFSPDVPAWEEEDDYFQQYFSGAGTFALATPVSVAPSTSIAGIDAHLVSRKAPPAPPVASPAVKPISAVSPRKKHCRKGLKRIKVKGKERCVRIHRKRHHARGGKRRPDSRPHSPESHAHATGR